MNFGNISPSGLRLFAAPPSQSQTSSSIRSKSGRNNNKVKLDITELLKPLNSKGAGLQHNYNSSTPVIYGSTKNLALLQESFHSPGSTSIHGQRQSTTRLYGSNEDINQNHKTISNKSYSESHNNIGSSRIPDIQMINKYYGLIPKKFTMHTRHSADRNHRNLNSSTKLRAKSAFSLSKNSSSLDEQYSISPSDTEYNEPMMKVEVKSRRRGSTQMDSEIGDDKLLNNGLTTKKISVEKHKKWKNRVGGGESKSLSIINANNGSLQNCHANSCKCGESNNKESQRVIKIDLNNMSWEESYQSYSPTNSEEPLSPYSSPKHLNNLNESSTNAINDKIDLESSSSQLYDSSCGYVSGESPAFSTEGPRNFANGSSLSSSTMSIDKLDKGQVFVDGGGCGIGTTNNNNQDYRFTNEIQVADDESSSSSSVQIAQMQNQSTFKAISNNANGSHLENSSVARESTSGVDNKSVASAGGNSNGGGGSRRGILRKTISFDEQLLRPNENNNYSNNAKSETEGPKHRRPMTASTKHSPPVLGNLNPPSKVLPWTQRSGQGMTVAERRAKLQKSISIHSSDSFEYGDGEASDLEGDSSAVPIPPAPNSSAYKETRKSLFFQQAPEVPTMISQISPIETLEIQVEIEKVAVMLKNMQNQNKSFIDLTPGGADFSSRLPDKRDNNNDFSKDTRDINGNSGTSQKNSFTTIASIVDSNLAIISEDKASQENNGEIPLSSERENKTDDFHLVVEQCNANNLISKNLNTISSISTVQTHTTTQESLVVAANLPLTDVNSVKTDPVKNIEEKNAAIVGTMGSSSCAGDPIPSKVQILPSPMRRPPLRKSVSISCEKELLGTPGYQNQNEVNGNGTSSTDSTNNGNKGSRPKTAVGTSKTLSRTSSVSSLNSERARSFISNQNHHRSSNHNQNHNRSPSDKIKSAVTPSLPPQGQQQQKPSFEENNQSQALRNRKILIKKALIEINQSSVQLSKKWGIMGRPKTAPSPTVIIANGSSNNNNNKTVTPVSCSQSQKRQPLKASPPTVGKVGPSKGFISNQTTEVKSESEDMNSKQNDPDALESENSTNSGGKRTLHRQSFSLDEGQLLSFSNKEFGWSSMDETNSESIQSLADFSFLNSKKREECLKIYEKMMKTGFAVKLDTIFRGMMTPSEYRSFIKRAENAARAVAEAEEEAKENEKLLDAGVKTELIT